jgi:hypothetical protein
MLMIRYLGVNHRRSSAGSASSIAHHGAHPNTKPASRWVDGRVAAIDGVAFVVECN